ncbi:hypothetical protein AS202_15345 [Myroides odoratimimus]|uniref:Uncharacterized protein n=2 Tax=Myroides odoratimimus TaxID=76832 RepID=A0AAI8G654_9FLAO|nr:hypothetical protein AS202_15345 [Myroides odoratimimus]
MIEMRNIFELEDFERYLNHSKLEIISKNDNDSFEKVEESSNKIINNYSGLFLKFKIIKQNKTLGYLEAFKSNNLDYLLIYTSPL